MENYFGPHNETDMNSFNVPDPNVLLFEDAFPEVIDGFNPPFDLDQALDDYTASSLDPRLSSPNFHTPPAQNEQISDQSTQRSSRRTMFLEPMPVKPRTTRALSPDSIERRRRQNRASQIAFRERKRKKTGELHQELIIAAKQNLQMHATMRELLRKTEQLKTTIEQAIASNPPITSNWSNQNSSEYQSWSPSDSDHGPKDGASED